MPQKGASYPVAELLLSSPYLCKKASTNFTQRAVFRTTPIEVWEAVVPAGLCAVALNCKHMTLDQIAFNRLDNKISEALKECLGPPLSGTKPGFPDFSMVSPRHVCFNSSLLQCFICCVYIPLISFLIAFQRKKRLPTSSFFGLRLVSLRHSSDTFPW